MENKRKIPYSIRIGKYEVDDELKYDILSSQFLKIYDELKLTSYFQKYLGYTCYRNEYPEFFFGKLADIKHSVFVVLKKRKTLWPIEDYLDKYTEDDLFDMIEFLFDNCSKPIDEVEACEHEQWGGGTYFCGYHHSEFDDKLGQDYFRQKLNPLLNEYKTGFELTTYGEIVDLTDKNLATIFDAEIPSTDEEKIKSRIEIAVKQFRKRGSSIEDRKLALIELFGVLELLRDTEMQGLIQTKDQESLFNIANNFSIRHNNLKQQNDYDKPIFYSWIFYYLLATIHAVLRLIEKKKNN